jgi:uncharacterized protein RhaS with RHS repeats
VAGSHYNYFRDYDPQVGREIESDLIGLDGGANTYAYVTNRPTMLADPLGLEGVGAWTFPAGPMRDNYLKPRELTKCQDAAFADFVLNSVPILSGVELTLNLVNDASLNPFTSGEPQRDGAIVSTAISAAGHGVGAYNDSLANPLEGRYNDLLQRNNSGIGPRHRKAIAREAARSRGVRAAAHRARAIAGPISAIVGLGYDLSQCGCEN